MTFRIKKFITKPELAVTGKSKTCNKAYAEDLYRACLECGYDGYDWDYEPGGGMGVGPLWSNKVQRTIFVEELSYWFGHGAMDPNRDRGDRPMPEKRLLFLIDGEVGIRTGMDKEWLSYYVDYFVLQAYGGMADYRMTGVLRDMDDWISARDYHSRMKLSAEP